MRTTASSPPTTLIPASHTAPALVRHCHEVHRVGPIPAGGIAPDLLDQNLTFESDQGFRPDLGRASWGCKLASSFPSLRLTSIGSARWSRPERPAEARLASTDRLADRGRGRHERDHARRASPRPASGAVRNALPTRALKGCCATRRGLRASRSLIPLSPNAS